MCCSCSFLKLSGFCLKFRINACLAMLIYGNSYDKINIKLKKDYFFLIILLFHAFFSS